jgi:hypothetical protein
MPVRPRAAIVFLLLALAGLVAPLVAQDVCDDPCGDHCGDCAGCPLVGDLSGASHRVELLPAELAPGSDRSALLPLARVLDHVPLDR